jgi:hypothetical protein
LWIYSIILQVIALFVTLVSCMLLTWTVKRFEWQFQKCYGKIGNLHIKIHDWKWTTEFNIVELDTVHGHKYSSPSIFYYIFHIKPHFFKKIILKPSLGRFLWNLFQDMQNSLNFICLSDSNFCLWCLFSGVDFSDFIFVKIYSIFGVPVKCETK